MHAMTDGHNMAAAVHDDLNTLRTDPDQAHAGYTLARTHDPGRGAIDAHQGLVTHHAADGDAGLRACRPDHKQA